MTQPPGHVTNRRWTVRVVVYVMLLASSGATFLLHDWLWRTARAGAVPLWLPLLPVVMFTAFVAFYVADRWLLVRRHGYPPVRAFFQVGVAVAFLAILWPPQADELRRSMGGAPRSPRPPQAVRLLDHRDAEVRAAACELAAFRGDTTVLDTLDTLASADASSAVRDACRAAADHLRQP
jgi:hypothetical protein